jgi:rhomboid family protein
MNSILEDFKQAFRTGNILNQLIVINVIVFVLFGVLGVFMELSGAGAQYSSIYNYLALPSNTNSLISQPLSILSYMFMHSGVFHILWNMLFLYWFGKMITGYLGQNKLLGLYVWGGIVGGLLYIIAYNVVPYYESLAGNSSLVGASGAVMAVVVGAATFQPNFSIQLFLIGSVKIKYFAAFVVLTSFFQVTGSNAGGEIAHLGGALMGYIIISQLQQGNDWSKSIVSVVTGIKGLFKNRAKMNVSYKSKQKTKRTKSKPATKSTHSKTATPQADIDAILDKISDKGYDALSKEEKQKLFNASKN